MATSGTFNFNPGLGEIVLFAFAQCGVRRTEILNEHMANARLAANMLLVDWANEGPNLWEVDLQSQVLTQGTATYAVDPSTIMILDSYIQTGTGETIFDRVITPVSRTEYSSYPNKLMQGGPTVYWYDRLISPSITVWQVPDGNGPYTLFYYRFRQTQDANYVSGQTVEIPWRMLSAFAYGLAKHLAVMYAPDRYAAIAMIAKEKQDAAFTQDTENVNVYIAPDIGSYYRR